MIVVVTGANGFLGSHIVRYLGRRGYDVRALVRPHASCQFLNPRICTIVRSEMNSPADFVEVFRGADAVVHVAALARDWGPWKSFEQANVEMTKQMAQAVTTCKIPYTVHISTNAVLGEEDCTTPKGETHPYNARLPYALENLMRSAMNFYRESKMLGERSVIQLAKQNKLNLSIVRPVWIFGPREFHAGPYEYCKTVASGTPVFPGSSSNLFHAVFVEDVARLIELLLQRRPAGINIYNCGAKQVLTMKNFWHHFATALGKRHPIALPKWLLWPAVTLLEMLFLALKMQNPPTLTRARLYMFYANNIYDVSKAERELGFVANTDYQRAINKTVRWWRLNKFL